MNVPVIILGGGGHAKVLIDVLNILSIDIVGYAAKEETVQNFSANLKYIGNDNDVLKYTPDSVRLVNAIGSTGFSDKRSRIFDFFKQKGYSFINVIHPSAVISENVYLGEGVQIMAGTVIQAYSSIGHNTIINTRSSVDHDCIIGDNVHISPGVTICGDVRIGDSSHIGAGSSIIQGIRVGRNCIVGAGALVINNVSDGKKVIGVPAKEVNH